MWGSLFGIQETTEVLFSFFISTRAEIIVPFSFNNSPGLISIFFSTLPPQTRFVFLFTKFLFSEDNFFVFTDYIKVWFWTLAKSDMKKEWYLRELILQVMLHLLQEVEGLSSILW